MNNLQIDESAPFEKYIKIFFVYNIVWAAPLFISLPPITILLANFISTLLLFWYARLFIDYSSVESKLKFLVYLLLIWNVICIFRSFSFDFRVYGRMLASPDFMLPFLFPFLVFLKGKLKLISLLNRTIILFDLVYLIGLVLFAVLPLKSNIFESFNDYEYFSKHFAYANGLLLLTYSYQTRKVKFLTIIVFLVSLIIALVLARRGQVMIISLFGIMAWLLHVFYINRKNLFKNILIYSSLILMFYFGFSSKISNLFNNNFSYFVERIDHNSRDFAQDQFLDDMKPIDYVFGRGVNGRYKITEDVDNDYEGDTRTEEEKQYRYLIETGYLNLILKGGSIALVLTVLISLIAILKGLFGSSNGYVKACSFFILVNLIALYPESTLSFTLRYMLIWICIGFCVSQTRNLTNDQIKELLNIERKNQKNEELS